MLSAGTCWIAHISLHVCSPHQLWPRKEVLNSRTLEQQLHSFLLKYFTFIWRSCFWPLAKVKTFRCTFVFNFHNVPLSFIECDSLSHSKWKQRSDFWTTAGLVLSQLQVLPDIVCEVPYVVPSTLFLSPPAKVWYSSLLLSISDLSSQSVWDAAETFTAYVCLTCPYHDAIFLENLILLPCDLWHANCPTELINANYSLWRLLFFRYHEKQINEWG